MLLFLDFDGVLHPFGVHSKKHFCCLPLFETLLRDLPSAQVVLSTSWREFHPFTENQNRFSEDLRHRVIGETRTRVPSNELPERLHSFARHGECWAWMRENTTPGTPWIALEDDPWRFMPFCPNVFLTDPKQGLSLENVNELRSRLLKAEGPHG